jgi:hypothetical protein
MNLSKQVFIILNPSRRVSWLLFLVHSCCLNRRSKNQGRNKAADYIRVTLMEIKETIKSQYLASLEMLHQAVIKCPDSLWNDSNFKNKFWHITYHVLFYTHLYLQESEQKFVQWSKHKDQYQFMGLIPWPPHNEPEISEPYTKDDILEYLLMCKDEVDLKLDSTNLNAESGFSWLPFNKLELQYYNIRHIQHHTGQLYERLRTQLNMGLGWVGMKHISK